MVVAIAFVTWLALRDADQRATTRRATVRERPGVARRAHPAPWAPLPPASRVPAQEAALYVPGGRVRAGLALSVLATFIGVIVALAVAAGIAFVAEGLRNTVR